jgi:predicted regulator of Ras-like GTPase activity (Roadblock/LC7/MglB family)
MPGPGGEGAAPAGAKEAVRAVLDSVIRMPWARAAGVVKKSFGREEDEGVREGMVGDSALFAGRIATLYGIGEKLLQEFEAAGPDRATVEAGGVRVVVLDLDEDAVLVAVVDATADPGDADDVLEEARRALRALQ